MHIGKSDAQMSTGKDFRQKVKDELTKDLQDIGTMFKDGVISATVCVYGIRSLRKIVPYGTHSYPVNDDKARWAELDQVL